MNYFQPFYMGYNPTPCQQQMMAQIPQMYPQILPADPMSQMGPIAPPQEQSYIENILRLNIGKVANVYMNFENSQWGSKIFKGVLLAAGKDHIVLKDLNSEMRYLLLTIYLSYIAFDEEINYDYPYRKISK